MESADLFWLAGLLEGEASFCSPTKSKPASPFITIHMVDADIIGRVASLFGKKMGTRIFKNQPNKKTQFYAVRCGKVAITIMNAIAPYMGERRRHQIACATSSDCALPLEIPEEYRVHWLNGLL